jgi:hypothetical protein
MIGAGRHRRALHPATPCHVELVAYERVEGGFDVFVHEPAGVLPADWEGHRVDASHVFLIRIDDTAELEAAVLAVNRRLGPDYERVLGHREQTPGERRTVQRLMHRLHKAGATGYALQQGHEGRWELVVRRRDLALLA